MTKSGIRWVSNDLQANLDKMDEKIQAGMLAGAQYVAQESITWMRTNAPWTDRTGAARNGLNAKVVASTKRVGIVLYHSVDYGIWLELRWAGRYAVIRPAVQAMAPRFVEVVGKLVFKS